MKTYIWTLPTRLFHWLLAFSFTIAFILGGEEEFIHVHSSFGVFIGILVFFRIIQGFYGPRYTRFRDFPVSFEAIRYFLTRMKESKSSHPGHNPLASVVMLSIFFMALLSAVSGIFLTATDVSGFCGLRLNTGIDPDVFGEVHEVVVHLFLLLVGFHLAGVIFDTMFHPQNKTIFSIITGYKQIEAAPAVLSRFQFFFTVFWLLVPAAMFFYTLRHQSTSAGTSEGTEQVDENEKEENYS
jgi:cytochrome b